MEHLLTREFLAFGEMDNGQCIMDNYPFSIFHFSFARSASHALSGHSGSSCVLIARGMTSPSSFGCPYGCVGSPIPPVDVQMVRGAR